MLVAGLGEHTDVIELLRDKYKQKVPSQEELIVYVRKKLYSPA